MTRTLDASRIQQPRDVPPSQVARKQTRRGAAHSSCASVNCNRRTGLPSATKRTCGVKSHPTTEVQPTRIATAGHREELPALSDFNCAGPDDHSRRLNMIQVQKS